MYILTCIRTSHTVLEHGSYVKREGNELGFCSNSLHMYDTCTYVAFVRKTLLIFSFLNIIIIIIIIIMKSNAQNGYVLTPQSLSSHSLFIYQKKIYKYKNNPGLKNPHGADDERLNM